MGKKIRSPLLKTKVYESENSKIILNSQEQSNFFFLHSCLTILLSSTVVPAENIPINGQSLWLRKYSNFWSTDRRRNITTARRSRRSLSNRRWHRRRPSSTMRERWLCLSHDASAKIISGHWMTPGGHPARWVLYEQEGVLCSTSKLWMITG